MTLSVILMLSTPAYVLMGFSVVGNVWMRRLPFAMGEKKDAQRKGKMKCGG